MNKMNKKGFTLIEMLVVIAIIAILVSIIIPTVMSSTNKAKAATNAANLRSCKAEIVTKLLTENEYDISNYSTTAEFYSIGAENETDAGFAASESNDIVTVTYNGLTINDWAELAGQPTDDNAEE